MMEVSINITIWSNRDQRECGFIKFVIKLDKSDLQILIELYQLYLSIMSPPCGPCMYTNCDICNGGKMHLDWKYLKNENKAYIEEKYFGSNFHNLRNIGVVYIFKSPEFKEYAEKQLNNNEER